MLDLHALVSPVGEDLGESGVELIVGDRATSISVERAEDGSSGGLLVGVQCGVIGNVLVKLRSGDIIAAISIGHKELVEDIRVLVDVLSIDGVKLGLQFLIGDSVVVVGVSLPEELLSELKALVIALLGRILHVALSRVVVGRGLASRGAHVLTGVGIDAGVLVGVVVLRHAVAGAVRLIVFCC